MKKLRNVFAVAVAAALACTVFAACGDTEEPEQPVSYTVSFNVNGGTLAEGASASVTVKEGESITLPAATQTDYTFEGWYHNEELVGLAGATYKPTASVTLKAEWEEVVKEDYALINGERATEYAKLINELYWDSNTQLSKLTPQGGTPYLWPYTEQASMVNGILLSMDKTDENYEFFKTYLKELLEGLRYYRVKEVTGNVTWQNANHKLVNYGETDGTANSYAIYNSGRNNSAKDSVVTGTGGIFFDDNIWVAKEFYYAYLNLGEVKYLNESINIVNWIVGEGYEDAVDLNGIYWNWSARYRFGYKDGGLDDSVHASLNACSSAPTAMMLAKLHTLLSGDEALKTKFSALVDDYLDKAVLIYEFCYQTLRDPSSGCMRDKIFLKEGFETLTGEARIELMDAQTLPYNTGTFMTAGAELYHIYAAKADGAAMAKLFNKRNQKVAQDADRFFANTQVVPGQYSYHENSWFTSFILEGFIDLDETGVDCSEYIEHMRSALDYAWKNHRAEDKLVCPAWVAGWGTFSDNGANSEGNPRQILLQSANAHCYSMLARYFAD